jgi:hypothetical protein
LAVVAVVAVLGLMAELVAQEGRGLTALELPVLRAHPPQAVQAGHLVQGRAEQGAVEALLVQQVPHPAQAEEPAAQLEIT